MQANTPTELPYNLFEHLTQNSPLQGLPDHDAAGEQDSLQALTTAYITTLYFSALSNLYVQSELPADAANTDEWPRLKIALARSYTDFKTAAAWLAEHQALIATSTAKAYYDEVMAMGEDAIINI